MVNIIITAIYVLPWVWLPIARINDNMRMPKAIMFDVIFMAIICISIFNGMKFTYKNRYLALLAGWVFITIGFNWYYPILTDLGYNAGTIEASIHFILSLVVSVIALSTLIKDDYFKIAQAICYSSTFVAFFGILQGIGFDSLTHLGHYSNKYPNHVAALLDSPDTLGNFLSLSLPFFLIFNKAKMTMCMCLVGFCLFMTHSSLSIVAAILSCFCFLSLKYRNVKRIRWGIIGLFTLFGIMITFSPLFNKIYNGFNGRVEAWEYLWDKLHLNPIFGLGLGIVKSLGVHTAYSSPQNLGMHWFFAHNDYLEISLSLGLLGLFLFLLVVIHSLKNFNIQEDNKLGFVYFSSFIGFLILMFGSFPMEIAPNALLGLIGWWGTEKI